ncbi:MAG TPA: hypothetical protein VGB17_07070 [Pyrinomonadaceae bacterium]
MIRRLTSLALLLALCGGAGIFPALSLAVAQDKGQDNKNSKQNKNNPTAEQIAESVIFIYGSREQLKQIRRNGIERGKVTRIGEDGRTEETSYERRFIRGESSDKDKMRLDQKTSAAEYSLVYGEGRTWGIINGAAFTPRQEASEDFLSQMWHGIDAFLRYKENGSTVAFINRDTQKGLDLYVMDLTDKEKRKTRYYISAKTLRILWLEYEQPGVGVGSKPVKFMKKFADYRYAQGTLVPFKTTMFEDGKQTQEMRIQTVTFGVKMEDSFFRNPEAQASTLQP